jgi:hypothetical protein
MILANAKNAGCESELVRLSRVEDFTDPMEQEKVELS